MPKESENSVVYKQIGSGVEYKTTYMYNTDVFVGTTPTGAKIFSGNFSNSFNFNRVQNLLTSYYLRKFR